MQHKHHDSDAYKELLYAVAHDFNASIRAMTQFSELLMEKAEKQRVITLDDDSYKWLSLIQQNGAISQKMIAGLQRISRLTQITHTKQLIGLHTLAKETLTLFAEKFPANQYQLISGQEHYVYGNRELWSCVIKEFIQNASIFHPESDSHYPLISVSLLSKPAGIRVEDNGISVPHEMLSEITRPFVQCNPEQRYTGIGVGLSICKRVASIQGATIHFSIPHEGGFQVTYRVAE